MTYFNYYSESLFTPNKTILLIAIVLGITYYYVYDVISTTFGWTIYLRGLPCIDEGTSPNQVPFISNVSISDEWYAASHPSQCRGSQLELIFSYVHSVMKVSLFIVLAYISTCFILAIYTKKLHKKPSKN